MGLRGATLLPITRIERTDAGLAPIKIDHEALGPNTPRRALCLGPDQMLYIRPTPVAAHTLVNGTTIRRLEGDPSELFQIDFGRAEVILAEGVALSSSRGASKRL